MTTQNATLQSGIEKLGDAQRRAIFDRLKGIYQKKFPTPRNTPGFSPSQAQNKAYRTLLKQMKQFKVQPTKKNFIEISTIKD